MGNRINRARLNDWRIKEFNIQDIIRHNLDTDRIVETGVAKNPDLSNVEEICFMDLMPSGKSSSCSSVDRIELD